MENKQIQGFLIDAVQRPTCSILKGTTQCELPERSNSVVRYSLWSITEKVLEAASHVFTEVYSHKSSITEAYPQFKEKGFYVEDLMNFGSNFVQIIGAPDEPMHIHASTIIVQIVQGKGTMIHMNLAGDELRDDAEEGDTIVIPVGAPHFFHGNPTLTYTGIEFGPVLDYQKHHLI